MRSRNLVIFAVSSYLFFLLLLLPASHLFTLFSPPASVLKLSGISGSVWSGSVDKVTIKNYSLDSLAWSLNPLLLFAGNIGLDLQSRFAGQSLNTELDYSLFSKKVLLKQLNSNINASELQKQLKLPFGELVGTIQLDIDRLEIKPGQLPDVSGQLSWKQAQIKLYSTISMGHISLIIASADNGELSGQLSNSGGEVSISGDIKVNANKSYNLNIKLKPRSNASKDLLNILSLVAPRKINAEHIIQRSGRLSELGF